MLCHNVPWCTIMYHNVPLCTKMYQDLSWCIMYHALKCTMHLDALRRRPLPPMVRIRSTSAPCILDLLQKKTSPILFETARIHLLQSFNFCSKQKLPHESSNAFGAAVSCLQTSAFSDERADFMQRQGARSVRYEKLQRHEWKGLVFRKGMCLCILPYYPLKLT